MIDKMQDAWDSHWQGMKNIMVYDGRRDLEILCAEVIAKNHFRAGYQARKQESPTELTDAEIKALRARVAELEQQVRDNMTWDKPQRGEM